jgi:hypothetical protein
MQFPELAGFWQNITDSGEDIDLSLVWSVKIIEDIRRL